MQTFNNLFDSRLREALAAEIVELSRILGEGNAADYAAYRYAAGRIKGLEDAIEFCDKVKSDLEKS